MNKFGYILGRESELSKAEILAVLRREKIFFEKVFESKDVLILALEKVPKITINELGGTIKLFRVLGGEIDKGNVKNFIQTNFELEQVEKRVNFGISAYGKVEKDFVYKVGKTLKNELLEGGLKARFVTGKFKDLSSVIVTENKLLERGFEAILVEDKGKIFVGRTIEVQNYKAYSKRDYGRTSRDDKSGMLPPKLAQILINLSGIEKDKVLYDPFCGSGTILQEAILLGYENVIGSDISPKAVEDTKENLRWLSANNVISSELEKSRAYDLAQDDKFLFVSDVLNPSKQVKADAIVAEGFLGEPTRRNVAQAKADAEKLVNFYLKALSNLARMLNSNGKIVIALPFFIVGKEKIFLPIMDKLSLTGLNQVILPDTSMTLRHSYLYARPDAFVGREIFIFEL